jgi:hypothetical protein
MNYGLQRRVRHKKRGEYISTPLRQVNKQEHSVSILYSSINDEKILISSWFKKFQEVSRRI